jgi:hypothetical protein
VTLAGVIRDLMRSTRKSKDATAVMLRQLIPACPVCNGKLESHQYAVIATTIIGEQEKPRVTELISHVRMHHWDALSSFKEWKGDRDDVVVYAIRGPHDAGVVILVRSPYELYENDELFVQEMVTAEELAVISGLVPLTDWRPL